LIAETWLYCRGDYPAPGNRQAIEAADIYWRLLGAERQPWGDDNLIAWRHHFRAAGQNQTPAMMDLRAEYQRHLRESARMETLLFEGCAKDGN
jgi:hypothetical protein